MYLCTYIKHSPFLGYVNYYGEYKLSTYVYVKRSKIRYNYKNPRNVEFKRVPMATAFNMCHKKDIGWERAKKGEYEEWLKATKKKR